MNVSVVIPVFNRAKMIHKALDSLVDQIYKQFEVIIVDDGSTDNLDEVIDSYRDQLQIIKLTLEHCGNIAFLRNQGFLVAQGEFIAVLDSDDWCRRDRIEKQRCYLMNNDIDVVASWVELIDECTTDNTRRLDALYNSRRTREELIDVFLNEGCCICNSSVMIRRSAFEKVGGYDERMIICEDFNLWIKFLLQDFKISIIEEKLIIRKLHKKSVTEGYSGNPVSVGLVLKNKIELLKALGKLDNRLVIWGVNSRNELLLSELSAKLSSFDYAIIDIYNGYPDCVDTEAFHLVTTFSKKDEVFNFLTGYGLKRTDNYIYS